MLYLGPFNPEDVVRDRLLPARNPAAYNRMIRLAEALASGGTSVEIVSTGVALQMGLGRRIIYRLQTRTVSSCQLTLLPGIGLPLVGFLCEPFIIAAWLINRLLFRRPSALVVYNATIASAVGVVIATVFRVPVVYEVEDIPTLDAVWRAGRGNRPRLWQIASFVLASRIQMWCRPRILVPARRFLDAILPRWALGQPVAVIPGCMNVTTARPALETLIGGTRPLRVLFAGKLEEEHGYDLLVSAIRIIASDVKHSLRIEFDICGRFGTSAAERLYKLPDSVSVRLHGFTSDDRYRELLELADLGLALQRTSGVFSGTRTPSKAYEFLASGKLLIGTGVGDLPELFPHGAVELVPETAERLAALLIDVSDNPRKYLGIVDTGLAIARSRYSYEAACDSLAPLLS